MTHQCPISMPKILYFTPITAIEEEKLPQHEKKSHYLRY